MSLKFERDGNQRPVLLSGSLCNLSGRVGTNFLRSLRDSVKNFLGCAQDAHEKHCGTCLALPRVIYLDSRTVQLDTD